MSENLDLVRSILAAHERGDYSSADWADPDIEYVIADGPEPVVCRGRAAMAKAWGDVLGAYIDHRMVVEEICEIDEERILVRASFGGRGKASGIDASGGLKPGVTLYQVRSGRVIRHVVYWDPDRALAELGLEE
jgi:ketosteroid isomerase-like protein